MAINTVELESEARFLMGGLPETVLSSDTMQIIISRGITKYSDTDDDYCKVLYYTIIESLRYLIRSQTVDSASNNASGSVTSRTEKEGKREISVSYSDGSGSSVSWEDMLNDFLENPQYVCSTLVDTGGRSTVIIGDGDKDGFTAAYESRSRWDSAAYDVKRRNYRNWPWRSDR